MGLPSDNEFEILSSDALRRLVADLSQRLGALEGQIAEPGDQLEKTEAARADGKSWLMSVSEFREG